MPTRKRPQTVKEKLSSWEGGARELDHWIWSNKKSGKDVAWLAEDTGLSIGTIYAYCACRRYPTLLGALLVERSTGIPVSAWVNPRDLERPAKEAER